MQARVDLARVYLFMGNEAGVYDPALAREILVSALAKWPDTYYTPEACSIIGFSYHYEGDDRAAISCFEKMITDSPTSEWNSMLLNTIGNLHNRKGEKAEAVAAYNRCVQFDASTDWAQSSRNALASLATEKAATN